MSALPVHSHSPIQRLDFDVLSCIFKINADMFSNRTALETTLATSRVCRDWRNFMLNTSSIWAHLINFGDWHCRTVEGFCELIRRGGISLLWVKVPRFYDFDLPRVKFIMNLVAENWERIQKLQVTIGVIEHEHVDQWSQLYLPAPHLESFDITFTQESTQFNEIFSSLFGGNAPMLHELRFGGHRSNFTPRPSWMHQLRSLDLSVELTVSEMLEVLRVTEKLVNLRIDRPLVDHTTSTLPLVSLPQLAHLDLTIYGKLGPGAVFLDHMCIPPACSLAVSALKIQLAEIYNTGSLAPFIRAISSCARPHFTDHPPQQLWLTIQAGYFLLQTTTHSGGPTFKLCVEVHFLSQPGFPTHALTMLLSDFALPGLHKVTLFGCRITGVNRPVPGLTALMVALPSVNAITTDKLSLRHLRAWSAPKGGGTVPRIGFPALKILKLVSFPPIYWGHATFDSVPDPVSAYVKARIARGHALSVIDFAEEALDVLPHMAFLRKAAGLKVLWRQSGSTDILEYVCGTGAPRNPVSV